MSRKYVIQIHYKSGRDVVMHCDEFTFKGNLANGLTEVQWDKDALPLPLFINIGEIESIWRLVGAKYEDGK